MKLPLTRQKRSEATRVQELQELLTEIENSGPKSESSKVIDEGVVSSFMTSVERRASDLGMTTDELLNDYATRLRESKYPTADCLEPEEIQSIFDTGEPTSKQAEHLANCLPCQQLVAKSRAMSSAQLERILADIRVAAPEGQAMLYASPDEVGVSSDSTKDKGAEAVAATCVQEQGEIRSTGLLKLILADDQAIFRAGIAKVLAVEDEIRIVAQAQTSEQMFMALDKFRAAVLIVADNFYDDFNSLLQSANRVRTRVIVLGDTGESAHKYMAAGAHGVLYRNVTSSALVDCVRKVARGETWVQDISLPVELTENDMVGLRVRDRLTAKELRIVALIVQGYKNKEIASQLGTTEQVIKNYLRNVYDKIGVSDRLEVALFAIRHRLFSEGSVGTAVSSRIFVSSSSPT
jgi:DNA-binding NarL/FixJ family response regulator